MHLTTGSKRSWIRAPRLRQPPAGWRRSTTSSALFDSLPPEVQKRYLIEVIDDLPTLTQGNRPDGRGMGKGDADALAALMNAEQDDPALIERC